MAHEIKEKPFTYNYFQPADYHFSMDSIHLPWRVSKLIKEQDNYQVLDLCAGCGVMGFELSYHCHWLNNIDFIEVQKEYEDYFDKNKKLILESLKTPQNQKKDLSNAIDESNGRSKDNKEFQFLNLNYNQVKNHEMLKAKYDLIICNPPYFFKEKGSQSQNNLKNRSRFYIDASFEELIEAMRYLLKPDGQVHMLFRSQLDHAIDDEEFINKIKRHFTKVEFLEPIRKTSHLRLS